MHILVNSDELAPVGGVEISSLQVCRELVTRGHGIDLLYREGGSLEGEWRAIAGVVRRSPSFLITQRTPVRDALRVTGAVRAAAGLRPDALWLNRAEHLVWGLATSRTTRAPLICHLRTHPHFPGLRTMARGVGRFIAVSGYVRDLWVDAGLDPDRVDVVLNGVDAGDYPFGGTDARDVARRQLGLDRDGYVVLHYGRLHPDKGIDVLLDAWRRSAMGEATLVLAGDPYPDAEGAAYGAYVRSLAGDGVRVLAMQRDVMPLLHAADTVVLPAQWQEPFGRVVAESLMSGRPVVASRVGGIPEQLTGEFARLMFDPQDARALAERLAALRTWRRDDPTLGERCARHAGARLSLRATTDGVERVVTAAIEDRARARPPRSRTRKASAVPEPMTPLIAPSTTPSSAPLTAAVVICAYTEKRWEQIRASIASVRAQSVTAEQLVLVVDHNDDLLDRARTEWPATGQSLEPVVNVVANRYPGRLGSARNTGVELLTTDVVAFLDDDAAADPTWLESLLSVYADSPAAMGVGGAPQPVYETARPAWFPEEFNWVYGCHYSGLPQSRGPARHLIGASLSARVDAVRKVQGFHSDNHDDMDLCHRLAGQFGAESVVYEPAATVRHLVTSERVTWSYFWQRCFQVNRGKVQAFADMGAAGNLAAEREFATAMLRGVLRRVRRGLRGDLPALAQAGAVVAGLALAAAGHVVGTVELRLGRTTPSPTRGLS